MRLKLSIAFLVIYLFAISGLTVNVHYCGGELASVKLVWDTPKSTCGCTTNKKKDKDCCKDKQVVVKIKENYKSSSSLVALKSFPTKLFVSVFCSFHWDAFSSEQPQLNSLYAHAPPDEPKQELFLLNCAFLI